MTGGHALIAVEHALAQHVVHHKVMVEVEARGDGREAEPSDAASSLALVNMSMASRVTRRLTHTEKLQRAKAHCLQRYMR